MELLNSASDDCSIIMNEINISYADCFVVTIAIREKAMIVTGDPDFKRFKDIVDIE